jgi:hypothetical protein
MAAIPPDNTAGIQYRSEKRLEMNEGNLLKSAMPL